MSTKACQALSSMVVIDAMKSLYLIIFQIFEPSKIPAFSFSSLRPGNALHKLLKQCSSYLTSLHTASLVLALYAEVEILFYSSALMVHG